MYASEDATARSGFQLEEFWISCFRTIDSGAGHMTGLIEKSSTLKLLAARLWTFLAFGLCVAESGCSDFHVKHLRIGEAVALATRADIRVITEPANPYPIAGEEHATIVCAEPSPDVALALSRALTAETHATTPAGVVAGASGGYQTNEAALALAGRTSAVVALRDGLFRACEAYANGIIGRDSYALILSQYGDLLVTLILGDSAATNVGDASPSPPKSSPHRRINRLRRRTLLRLQRKRRPHRPQHLPRQLLRRQRRRRAPPSIALTSVRNPLVSTGWRARRSVRRRSRSQNRRPAKPPRRRPPS